MNHAVNIGWLPLYAKGPTGKDFDYDLYLIQ